MAGRSKGGDSEEAPSSRGPFRRLRSLFWTLLVLCLILFGAAVLFSTTEGFRYLVSESVKKQFDWTLTIERSRLMMDGRLRLEDVRVHAIASTGSVLTVDRVDFTLDPAGFLGGGRRARHLDASGILLRVTAGSAEEMRDDGLARFWRHLSEVAGLSRPPGPGATPEPNIYTWNVEGSSDWPDLILRDVQVEERGPSGELRVQLDGGEFVHQRLSVPGHPLVYYRMVSSTGEAGDLLFRDLLLEWVTGSMEPVLLDHTIRITGRVERSGDTLTRREQETERKVRVLLDPKPRAQSRPRIPTKEEIRAELESELR